MKDVSSSDSQPTAPMAVTATLGVSPDFTARCYIQAPEVTSMPTRGAILFRATPGPTANRLIIEKWRASLPSM